MANQDTSTNGTQNRLTTTLYANNEDNDALNKRIITQALRLKYEYLGTIKVQK